MLKYILILSIALIISCDSVSQEKNEDAYDRAIVPYDLTNPSEKYSLHDQLEEISGLAWINGNIATINDEDGKVFIVTKEGKIISTASFAEGDDYEGIAVSDKTIYIVNSGGDIFIVGDSPNATNKIETALNNDNDVEALVYDKKNNRLLIGCKEEAGIGENLKGRAIYAFDIKRNIIIDKPVAIIKDGDIKTRLSSTKRSSEMKSFAPSGLAIHPGTGNLYIISHPAKSLVVLNPSFEVIEVVKLSSRTFKQAEGICFSPDGSLYIANEGDGGRANILRFEPN